MDIIHHVDHPWIIYTNGHYGQRNSSDPGSHTLNSNRGSVNSSGSSSEELARAKAVPTTQPIPITDCDDDDDDDDDVVAMAVVVVQAAAAWRDLAAEGRPALMDWPTWPGGQSGRSPVPSLRGTSITV